jgi:nanoRNase/pAp phosphatase (c-di-AMP/oligoRNAs hydrolase)
MDNTEKTNQITQAISNAKNIAIFPSKIGEVDAFAAGVGLYHVLKTAEKPVSFIYPGKLPEKCEDLIKDEEITSDVGDRELVVAIDYKNTPASKVHYSTENDILYLSLSPIPRDFDMQRIKAGIKGLNFDLIITIGAQLPEDLGATYKDLESEFKQSKILNLDNTDRNQRFGTLNVVDASEESLSMLVLDKTREWDLKLNKRAAKALLTGISHRELI